MIRMPGHFLQGLQVRNGEADPCSEVVYEGRQKRWEKGLKDLRKIGHGEQRALQILEA